MARDIFDLEATLSLNMDRFKSGLQDAENMASGFGSKVGGALGTAAKVGGGMLAAGTAAAVAFGKSAVDAGMDFDSSMSQVAATMGVTVDQISNLRDFAQEMGATTAFSATEAADALNYMALAGYDADTSMKMLPNVLNLAAAGGIDLASASDMVTDAQSALGLTLEETSTMVDQMAKASSKSNTSVAQLGDAMLTIGATARGVKGGTQELSTVLGVLADNGIKGSEGGTHLRNAILALQTPTDKGTEALAKLGMTYEDMYDEAGNLRSLPEIFQQMSASMEGMTQQSKDAIISGIFNKTDLAAVNALIGTTTDRWDELSEAIGDSEGAAEDMANTQLDNLEGDIKLFKSALEGAQIAISDKLTPSLRDFVQLGTDGLSKITLAFKEGGLDGAMDALGTWITDAITKITQKLPQVVKAGSSLIKALIEGLTKNIGQLTNAALEIGTLFIDMMLETVPKLGQAALVMITTLANDLRTTLPELIPVAVDAILVMVDGLIDAAPAILEAALQIILGLAEGLIESLPKLLERLPELIGSLVAAIIDFQPKIIKAGFELFVALVKNLPEICIAIVKAIAQIPIEVIKHLTSSDVLGDIADAGVEMFSALVSLKQQILDPIIEAISNITTTIWNGFTDFVGDMFTLGQNLITGLIDGITDKLGGLWNKIQEVGGGAVSRLSGLWDIASPSKKAKKLSGFFMSGLANGFDEGLPLIEQAMDNIDDVIDDAINEDDWSDYEMPITTSVSTSGDGYVYGKQTKTEALLAQILDALYNMGINIDGKTMVGHIAPYMDAQLGAMDYYESREVYA